MKARSNKTRAQAPSRLDRLAQLPLRFGKLKTEPALHAVVFTHHLDAYAAITKRLATAGFVVCGFTGGVAFENSDGECSQASQIVAGGGIAS